MKLTVLILLFLTSLAFPQQEEIQTSVDFAKHISNKIPHGWSVKNDFSKVIIQTDKDISLYNPTSREVADLIENVSEETGWKERVLLVLLFTPKLTEKEFQSLLKVRKQTLKELKEKYERQPGKWNPTEIAKQRIKVPELYTSTHSIYVEKFDHGLIFDETILKQYEDILKLVKQTFKAYKNP